MSQSTRQADSMQKLPSKLLRFLEQPGTFITPAERDFIDDMRKAASRGVGYGWMQQICEWEWQEKGVGAWGPEYYELELHRAKK